MKIEAKVDLKNELKNELKRRIALRDRPLISQPFSQFDPGSENNLYPHESLLPIAPSLVQ